MVIDLNTDQLEFSPAEVHSTLDYALRNEAALARLRRDYFKQACQRFESQHNLSSYEFLERFEAGELGDEAVYFDWYAAKRGFDLWDRRYRSADSSCPVHQRAE